MPSFRFGHATGADWRRTVAKCLEQVGSGFGSLGFVYATDVLADDFGSILEMLKSGTGVPNWVGTVGTGVLATGREYMDQPAIAVMVGDFDPAALLRSAAQTLAPWQLPRDIWIVPEIPVDNRGKLSRRKLAARYMATRPEIRNPKSEIE